jgi:hypothetical protein
MPQQGTLDSSRPDWASVANAGASDLDLVQYVAFDGVDLSAVGLISISIIAGDGGSAGGGTAGGGTAGGGTAAFGVPALVELPAGLPPVVASQEECARRVEAGPAPGCGWFGFRWGPMGGGPAIVFVPACGCSTTDGLHALLLSFAFVLIRRRG